MACVMSGCKAHPGKISYQNQDISFHRSTSLCTTRAILTWPEQPEDFDLLSPSWPDGLESSRVLCLALGHPQEEDLEDQLLMFPRDLQMKQIWLNIICTYNQNYTHKAHHRICSRHFEDRYLSKKDCKGLEGSKKILKLEYTGPRLKKTAIPTLHLGNRLDAVEKVSDKKEGWVLSHSVKKKVLVLPHPIKTEGLELTQPIKKESLDLSQNLSDPVKTEGPNLSHPVKKEIVDEPQPVIKEENDLYIGVQRVDSMLELEVPAITAPAMNAPVNLKKDSEKKPKIKNKKTRKRKPRTNKLSQIPLNDYPARVLELEKLLGKEKQKSNRRLMTVKALREKLRRMTLKTDKLQALLKLVHQNSLNGSVDAVDNASCLTSHIGDEGDPMSLLQVQCDINT